MVDQHLVWPHYDGMNSRPAFDLANPVLVIIARG